jgi:hypothetical protein
MRAGAGVDGSDGWEYRDVTLPLWVECAIDPSPAEAQRCRDVCNALIRRQVERHRADGWEPAGAVDINDLWEAKRVRRRDDGMSWWFETASVPLKRRVSEPVPRTPPGRDIPADTSKSSDLMGSPVNATVLGGLVMAAGVVMGLLGFIWELQTIHLLFGATGVLIAFLLGPITFVAAGVLAILHFGAWGPLLFSWGGLALLCWGSSLRKG